MPTTRVWRGDQPAVKMVRKFDFGGAWTGAEVISVTINGKVYNPPGGTVIATIVAGVSNGFNGLSAQEWPDFSGDILASYDSTAVYLTSKISGMPFTATITAAGGTGTITPTTPTANSGPNDWALDDNFDPAGAWANGDSLILRDSTVPILWNLEARSGITLARISQYASYRAAVGLPRYNGKYYEYRPTFLKVGATLAVFGQGPGQGSPLIQWDSVAGVDTSIFLYGTASAQSAGGPGFLWKGGSAASLMQILKGSAGLAYNEGDTAQLAALDVGYVQSKQADAVVIGGAGFTLADLVKTGGSVTLGKVPTNVTQYGGDVALNGSGGATKIVVFDGPCFWNSTGTLALFETYGKGQIDLSRDMQAKAVTAGKIFAAPANHKAFYDPFGVAVIPDDGIETYGCGCDAVERGQKLRITANPF